jgi:hypothetical protein
MNPLLPYLDPLPLIAVLRGITPEEVPAISGALIAEGFRVLEVRSIRRGLSSRSGCSRKRAGIGAWWGPAPCSPWQTSRACAMRAAKWW